MSCISTARIAIFIAAFGYSLSHAQDPKQNDAVKVIREESIRPNDNPEGKPLPLASHWSTNLTGKGINTNTQIDWITKGNFVMPWFPMPDPWTKPNRQKTFEAAFDKCAELNLPLTLVATQCERVLCDDPKFFNLPAEKNPNVVDASGKVNKIVCPFGPTENWREAGKLWGSLPGLKKLQEKYPNPPRVLFLSNNEQAKMRWPQLEKSSRFKEKYGDKSDDEKRQILADAWIEKYKALIAGFRESLTPEWQKVAVFEGYNAFGSADLGRYGGWVEHSLHTKGRISPWAQCWDGASPDFYLHNWEPSTDFTVFSPQTKGMNRVFMLEESFKANPNYWFELSVWDGYMADKPDKDKRQELTKKGTPYTPQRYRGLVQYGMWMFRPRIVREFRPAKDKSEEIAPYFAEVMSAVNSVHQNATLQKFWRKGELVANPDRKHPYQASIPEEYADVPRWYSLTSNLDPSGAWKPTTEIPVFSLALKLSEGGKTSWLVYAHAPRGDRSDVELTVPTLGPIKSNIAQRGTFLLVDGSSKAVTELK